MDANRLALDPALGGGTQPRPYESQKPDDSSAATTLHSESFRANATSGYDGLPKPRRTPYWALVQTKTAEHGERLRAAWEAGQRGEDPADLDETVAQDDAKRQRACEACRGLKVRCDQDPAQPDVPCKRCAKAGRPCVITQPSRKRQKKADSRVAELEKKLDALTAALEHRHATGSLLSATQTPSSADAGTGGSAQNSPNETFQQARASPDNPRKRRLPETDPGLDHAVTTIPGVLGPQTEANTSFYGVSVDALRAKINALVPAAESAELFQRYNEAMSPYLPMVVFPHGQDAKQVLQDRPILYLVIITVASSSMRSLELHQRLWRESMSTIADCVVRDGSKSLELIQAMLIIAAWYSPPERAEQSNFYLFIHMAAVMALDIGLGRRFRQKITPISRPEVGLSVKVSFQNSDALDARRAWLGCYYLSATASMVMRRPNLVQWTGYMKECIETLETSPDAYPTDKLLCQHVKIQHICEDIGLQFLMHDSTAQVSINDPKVTYAVVTLENQLDSWRKQVPDDSQCASLSFFEQVTSLYLHEIALHFNHNVDDFRLPLTEESLKNVDDSSDAFTPAQVAAIEACVKAAHGILDAILNFTSDELLALPLILYFVRGFYALIVLIKMHVAVCTPASELGKLMRPSDLKLEYYLDTLVSTFSRIIADISPKPEKALRITMLLRDWLYKYKEGNDNRPHDGTANTTAQSKQTATHHEQTPLHMLSQVATGQQGAQDTDSHADWTFSTPSTFFKSSYPDQKNAYYAQQGTLGMSAAGSGATNMLGTSDAATFAQGMGWGSGFEQAMDITLGSTSDLSGAGLDNWFLGDNTQYMYNDSSAGAAGGQWQ